ncbi:MAG: arylsulfatase, partial [Chthoniobacteraceae bacterium]
PALLGESKTGRENFVAHNGGTKGPFGLRAGTWKYITPGGAAPRQNDVPPGKNAGRPKPPAAAGAALFDLSADLGETKNLATEKPEKANELKLLLESIRGGV